MKRTTSFGYTQLQVTKITDDCFFPGQTYVSCRYGANTVQGEGEHSQSVFQGRFDENSDETVGIVEKIYGRCDEV